MQNKIFVVRVPFTEGDKSHFLDDDFLYKKICIIYMYTYIV